MFTYNYWELDEVRRKFQHAYDRKKCKRMRLILYKRNAKLTKKGPWYLAHYLGMFEDCGSYMNGRKFYCGWLDSAKAAMMQPK